MSRYKLKAGGTFQDSLQGLIKPVIDNTAAPIKGVQQYYDPNSKKLLPMQVPGNDGKGLYQIATLANSNTPAKYIVPTKDELKIKSDIRKANQFQSDLDEMNQAKVFHDNNPLAIALGLRNKPVTSLPATGLEIAQGLGSGIENYYKIPQIGIFNDFVNPLHMASDGIISPWAKAPQETQDIQNYYNNNPDAQNIFLGKQFDQFIPGIMAGVSTAMTIPFIKSSPQMIKGLVKAPLEIPASIGRNYRDIKYDNSIIKNGINYKNSYDFLNNNQFNQGLNKEEVNFLNKELEQRGILEQQRRHPLNFRSELSSRGIVPEDYNLKKVIGNFVPNIVKGKEALKAQYTMGEPRINAFNQYLGKPTKNSMYRIHSDSFKNGEGLLYTVPDKLINRASATQPLYPFNTNEFKGLENIEKYNNNPTLENKRILQEHFNQQQSPEELWKNPDFDYGKPILKGNKTVIPSWDYITGTGGGTSFVKEGNKVTMKDTWDIQPFSRNTRLPKFLQKLDAAPILGGKEFTMKQTYRGYPGRVIQTFKKGGYYD